MHSFQASEVVLKHIEKFAEKSGSLATAATIAAHLGAKYHCRMGKLWRSAVQALLTARPPRAMQPVLVFLERMKNGRNKDGW